MAYLTGEACLDPTKKLPHGASVIFDNLCCRGVARNAQFVKVCVYSQGVACYAPTENIIFVSLCTFEMYKCTNLRLYGSIQRPTRRGTEA